MPQIKPISDLRNNFSKISEIVHKQDEPVFLTKNGVGDMVVMSIDCYERQMARLELYRELDIAQTEIKNGAKGKDVKRLLKDLMS